MGTERLGREFKRSPQSSAEFKLVWIHLEPSYMPEQFDIQRTVHRDIFL